VTPSISLPAMPRASTSGCSTQTFICASASAMLQAAAPDFVAA